MLKRKTILTKHLINRKGGIGIFLVPTCICSHKKIYKDLKNHNANSSKYDSHSYRLQIINLVEILQQQQQKTIKDYFNYEVETR